jgi:hypothetical protein
MKRHIIWVILILTAIFNLVACSHENKAPVVDKKPNVIENKNKNTKSNLPKKQYENEAFKEVVITETDQGVDVTGKASVFEGVFQYAIVVGNKTVLQDKYQTAGAPAWGDFQFTIAKKFVKKGAMLELFVYSAKDGSKINILKMPINKN